MASSVVVTPLVFDSPVPNEPGTNLKYIYQEGGAVDYTLGRIYQLIEGDFGSPEEGNWYLAILDMDTCVETSRVTLQLIDAPCFYFLPVAVTGQNYLIASLTTQLAPYEYTCSINVLTGAVQSIVNSMLGTNTTGRANFIKYKYCLPYGVGQSFVLGNAVWDGYQNTAPTSDNQLTHSSSAAVIVDHSTGGITLQAWGQKGIPKTKLYTGSGVNTLGETFNFTQIPSRISYADKAVFYISQEQRTNGAVELPNWWRTIYLYKIEVDLSGNWTYDELGSLTEPDEIIMYEGGIEATDGNSIIFQFDLIAHSSVIEGVIYDRLTTIKMGNSGEITRAYMNTPPQKSAQEIRYVAQFEDVHRFYHRQSDGKIFAYPATNASADGTKSGLYFLDDTTLAVSTQVSGTLLGTRYNQTPFNSGNDNAFFVPDSIFIDNERCAVYVAFNNSWDGNWERWTFGEDICWPPDDDDDDEESLAIISDSIGQFTGTLIAMLEQPCPIVGASSHGRCLTARSSWSPGIGQVLCGRDDVALPCD